MSSNPYVIFEPTPIEKMIFLNPFPEDEGEYFGDMFIDSFVYCSLFHTNFIDAMYTAIGNAKRGKAHVVALENLKKAQKHLPDYFLIPEMKEFFSKNCESIQNYAVEQNIKNYKKTIKDGLETVESLDPNSLEKGEIEELANDVAIELMALIKVAQFFHRTDEIKSYVEDTFSFLKSKGLYIEIYKAEIFDEFKGFFDDSEYL